MKGYLRIGVSAMVTGTAASVVSTARLLIIRQRGQIDQPALLITPMP